MDLAIGQRSTWNIQTAASNVVLHIAKKCEDIKAFDYFYDRLDAKVKTPKTMVSWICNLSFYTHVPQRTEINISLLRRVVADFEALYPGRLVDVMVETKQYSLSTMAGSLRVLQFWNDEAKKIVMNPDWIHDFDVRCIINEAIRKKDTTMLRWVLQSMGITRQNLLDHASDVYKFNLGELEAVFEKQLALF